MFCRLCFTALHKCGHTNAYRCSIDIGQDQRKRLGIVLQLEKHRVFLTNFISLFFAKSNLEIDGAMKNLSTIHYRRKLIFHTKTFNLISNWNLCAVECQRLWWIKKTPYTMKSKFSANICLMPTNSNCFWSSAFCKILTFKVNFLYLKLSESF